MFVPCPSILRLKALQILLFGFHCAFDLCKNHFCIHDFRSRFTQRIHLAYSDYFPEDLIKEKHDEALDNHLNLHIWKRKEIENYLLEPEVLFRLSKQEEEKHDIFMHELERFVDTFEDNVFDQYAEHILKFRKIDVSTANAQAREYMKNKWIDLRSKLSMVGGKKFLKELIKWFRKVYGENITQSKIISEFNKDEFDEEIKNVIRSIC